jgi:hypothetical protein
MPGLAAPATKPLVSAPLPTKSVALPTATVQLAPPTQPMVSGQVSATQMPTIQSGDEEDAESDTLTTVLSIFGFLAACGVLAYQCMTISIWEGWNQLF